jgi:hypothetical protein
MESTSTIGVETCFFRDNERFTPFPPFPGETIHNQVLYCEQTPSFGRTRPVGDTDAL